MDANDEQGTIVAILERFRLQRLPRAMEIRDRVRAGGKLDELDIAFLEQVFSDQRDVQPFLERHPELVGLISQVAALYSEITETALANEKGG